MLRFAHALDDLAAATRRRPSPGECQYPVLPLGDDGLAQNNFDPLRADCGALDRVSYVILGRRVPSQTASLFVLRDRLVGAENTVVDVMGRGCNVAVQYGANQPEYDLMISDAQQRTLPISVRGNQTGSWLFAARMSESYHATINCAAAIASAAVATWYFVSIGMLPTRSRGPEPINGLGSEAT